MAGISQSAVKNEKDNSVESQAIPKHKTFAQNFNTLFISLYVSSQPPAHMYGMPGVDRTCGGRNRRQCSLSLQLPVLTFCHQLPDIRDQTWAV